MRAHSHKSGTRPWGWRRCQEMARSGKATVELEQPDGLEQRYGIELPYTVKLRLRGTSPFLFNRMDIDAYDREAGPGAKKKPRERAAYESMIWRDEQGKLALPTRNVIGSIASVGKYFYGPTRGKSTMKAPVQEGVVPGEEYAHFGVDSWDAIDFRHAKHGNTAKTPKPTYRPRLEIGWALETTLLVTVPEVLGPATL